MPSLALKLKELSHMGPIISRIGLWGISYIILEL